MRVNVTTSSPVSHLVDANRLYPKAWRRADEMRAERGKNLPDWPQWCFLPLAGWHSIVCEEQGTANIPWEMLGDVARLAALGAWRPTQSIYRFAPELYAALISTPLDGDLPTDILYRMPEWCMFLETPGLSMGPDCPVVGSFVHLEHDANTGDAELRILFAEQIGRLIPSVLHLGNWSLPEAWARSLDRSSNNLSDIGLGKIENCVSSSTLGELMHLSRVIINLLLYLCSEEPDARDNSGHSLTELVPSSPKRTKYGWRLYAPDKPRIWNVGMEIGRRLRDAAQSPRTDGTNADSPHNPPAPHIRRAHWHGYWTGPKKIIPEYTPQRFVLKWLPPIPVAMGNDEPHDIRNSKYTQ